MNLETKETLKEAPYVYFQRGVVWEPLTIVCVSRGSAEPIITNKKYFLRTLLIIDGTAEVVLKVLKNSGLLSKLNIPFLPPKSLLNQDFF